MAEKNIVTLLAERGKKFDETGEAIASHGRCLVFLPRGAEPGKNVRVELAELDKTDARGRKMYRGVPAPVEYTEKWKDNGDGTASRVTIATNWLGKTSEEGVVETRALETREAQEQATSRTDRVVMWGVDLASSLILEEQVKVVPTFTEKVSSSGTLTWERVSEQVVRMAPRALPIVQVQIWAGEWFPHQLQVVYLDSWTLEAQCFYGSGASEYAKEYSTWGKLPSWVQTQVMADYPVCSCGRQRRDAHVSDGYGKCIICRTEEKCERCGKQVKVENLSGRLVCEKCRPYEGAEQMIEKALPRESREAIAAEAKKPTLGQALPQEAGETILRATLDHITDDWRKNNLIERWSGYGWYYFCEDGIFATKLAPAALEILQFLPQASGNGLVEMVAWLADGPKPWDANRDFYLRTQVKGETGVTLVITEDKLKQIKIAEYLRGSEPDRVAALSIYQSLLALQYKAAGDRGFDELLQKVASLLEGEDQDYRAAIEAAKPAEQIMLGTERLRQLLARDYPACPVCEKAEPEGSWTAKEGTTCACLQEVTDGTRFILRQSIAPDGRVLLTAECDERGYVFLLIHDRRLPEISEIITTDLWEKPSEAEMQLCLHLRSLQQQLNAFDDEMKRVGEGGRVKLKWELDSPRPNKPTGLFCIQRVAKVIVQDASRQEAWTEIAGEIRFVCDPARCLWLEQPPQANETWSCNPKRLIGRDKKGRPVIVANPQMRLDSRDRRAIEAEIQKVEAEIRALKAGGGGKP